MKATKIWDVLNVATVDGGIMVNDLVVQKKPNRPKLNIMDYENVHFGLSIMEQPETCRKPTG